MREPYRYIGCFVSPEELFAAVNETHSVRLANVIRHPHITFAYRPEQVDESLFGKQVTVRIVGYGNDGRNEGVKVELVSADPEIRRMSGGIEVPHITLSVSDGSEPVATRYLPFVSVPPAEIEGIFGGYTGEEVITAPEKDAERP